MSFLSIGCDFSQEHVDTVCKLVERQNHLATPHRIVSVYGSPGVANAYGSVRPSSRETKVSLQGLEARLLQLAKYGIKTYLTLNSMFPHDKRFGLEYNIFKDAKIKDEFEDYLAECSTMFDGLIIAHPYLLEFMHNSTFVGEKTEVIISTIMNVHSLSQLRWIKLKWPLVKRVCPSLWKNRDMAWLTKANQIIPLELLVNEFCTIGGANCEGLYRQFCYMAQSLEITEEWNPMQTACIQNRKDRPWAWLMARFILPQWLKFYSNELNINFFKITGRTHQASFIKYVGEVYQNGEATGNLLNLWGQLEATLHKDAWSEEQKKATSIVNIPIEKLKDMLAHFFTCSEDACEINCSYCKNLYESIIREVQ